MSITSAKASVANPVIPVSEGSLNLSRGFRIALADAVPLEAAGAPLPVPARLQQSLQDLYLNMFSRPVDDTRQRLEQLPYAEVKVGGRVIATISNSGAVTMPNSSPYLKLVRTADGKALNGPELALHIAETLVHASGGTIQMADSAATQAEWLARPPRQWTVDYEAMAAFIERSHRTDDHDRAQAPVSLI